MADYIDLELISPWLNAAGTLGFAPAAEGWNFSEQAGGFVTNPVSAAPRSPAEARAVLEYPGGALLHSGLPNPGLNAVVRKYGERWARSTLPVWVHLLADSPDDIHRMALALEGLEGVAAIEVGIPAGAAPELALGLVAAAVGELPVVASLALSSAGEAWLKELPGLGARGICLGAPRGTLLRSGHPVSGRLAGPGLYPQVLAALRALVPLGLPVVAGCGVYSPAAGRELLAQGAAAVQLDTVLWLT